MALSEWILVFFGAGIALSGSWIQLNPERIFPVDGNWRPAPAALAQVRTLGGFFVFMGVFFAGQMALILSRAPWWTGTLSGLLAAIVAVTLLGARSRRRAVKHTAISKMPLEAR
jgi:uncharacterized membrane protein HdeD (DUF308 family)